MRPVFHYSDPSNRQYPGSVYPILDAAFFHCRSGNTFRSLFQLAGGGRFIRFQVNLFVFDAAPKPCQKYQTGNRWGKGDNAEGYQEGRDDFGRERVTGNIDDRYKFRTPSLRQVAQTGPWGHDGAFDTLEGMVRHHLEAFNSLNEYNTGQAVLPSRNDLDAIDFTVQNDPGRRQLIADAISEDLTTNHGVNG